MLVLRRVLAFLCYTVMLAADAAECYVIYRSVTGGITYYLGLLYFVPIFIVTYWMSTFFTQLTYGKVGDKRICPKILRKLLNWIATIISLALLAFWIYIYINQSEPVNENLVPSIRLFNALKPI